MRLFLLTVTVVIISYSTPAAQLTNTSPSTSLPPTEVQIPRANDPPAVVDSNKKAPCPNSKSKKKKTAKAKSSRTEPAEAGVNLTPNAERATQTPRKATSSQSKTIYDYLPDAIYRIYGSPLHIVDVQLQPGEVITGKVAAGDTVRWTVGIVAHGIGSNTTQHVLIKPIEPNLETNFIITTDKHSYHLSAKSDARYYVPTVGWNYPQEEMAKLQVATTEQKRFEEQVAAPALKAENLNFKYKIRAEDEYPWTPIRVFDDGAKTFIQMDPKMKNYQAPVLFIKTKEGLNLVNYRVKGDYYIVDRLFAEGELRSGKKDIVRIEREDKSGFWPWSR